MKTKRNSILAGFFNLICIGLGFVYVGKLKYSIGLFFICFFMALVFIKTKFIFDPPILYSSIAIYLIIIIGSIVFSGYLAKTQDDIPLKRYQRWYIYVAYYLIVSISSVLVVENRGMLLGYETYNIPSGAMIPTLLIGDMILVDADAYKKNQVSRGDVVVFRYPEDPSIPYVKRVIGIPGDKIDYENRILRINGERITEEEFNEYTAFGKNIFMSGANIHEEKIGEVNYQILTSPNRRTIDMSVFVPSDHYFVMGDNRDNSKDSRYWGFLPKENLIGKVNFIWFHWDNDVGLKTSRLGKIINR